MLLGHVVLNLQFLQTWVMAELTVTMIRWLVSTKPFLTSPNILQLTDMSWFYHLLHLGLSIRSLSSSLSVHASHHNSSPACLSKLSLNPNGRPPSSLPLPLHHTHLPRSDLSPDLSPHRTHTRISLNLHPIPLSSITNLTHNPPFPFILPTPPQCRTPAPNPAPPVAVAAATAKNRTPQNANPAPTNPGASTPPANPTSVPSPVPLPQEKKTPRRRL